MLVPNVNYCSASGSSPNASWTEQTVLSQVVAVCERYEEVLLVPLCHWPALPRRKGGCIDGSYGHLRLIDFSALLNQYFSNILWNEDHTDGTLISLYSLWLLHQVEHRLGAFIFQLSCTRCPLWITSGGTTFPAALTKDKTVDVSPCSDDTCWNVRIFLYPSTLISFGTFCMPVSSPDHICSGDVISTLSMTSLRRLYHWVMTVGFAPMALAMDRFLAFFSDISGWRFRNPDNHLRPAICLSSLNPVIPLTLAYWNANWHTLPIVKGNPESWKRLMVDANISSSAVK